VKRGSWVKLFSRNKKVSFSIRWKFKGNYSLSLRSAARLPWRKSPWKPMLSATWKREMMQRSICFPLFPARLQVERYPCTTDRDEPRTCRASLACSCASSCSTVCCTSVSFVMNVPRCIYREISRYLRDCKPPDFSDFRKRLRSPSLRRPSGSSEFRDVGRASLK
jgi:hypothetical protein